MVQGAMVGSDQTRAYNSRTSLESREQTIMNAKQKIRTIAGAMRIPDYIVESACGWFKLALVQNFVQGRRSQNVIAACLYVACRHEKTHHLLIDFSSRLQISVYSLGATYLKLVRALQIQRLPLADPSLFVQHFAERLNFGDYTAKVCRDATKIALRMSSDWIYEGRRPAGIAGACLLLAARMNNFRRSHAEIVAVARVGEETLQKRLNEFKNTKSAQLSVSEFRQSSGVDDSSRPPSYLKNRRIEKKIERLMKQRRETLETYKKLAQERALFKKLDILADNGLIKSELMADRDSDQEEEPTKSATDAVDKANGPSRDVELLPDLCARGDETINKSKTEEIKVTKEGTPAQDGLLKTAPEEATSDLGDREDPKENSLTETLDSETTRETENSMNSEKVSAPVESSEATSAPVENFETTSAPVENSEYTAATVESSENTSAPVESSKDTDSPVDDPENPHVPAESSENSNAPAESPDNTTAHVETSAESAQSVVTSEKSGQLVGASSNIDDSQNTAEPTTEALSKESVITTGAEEVEEDEARSDTEKGPEVNQLFVPSEDDDSDFGYSDLPDNDDKADPDFELHHATIAIKIRNLRSCVAREKHAEHLQAGRALVGSGSDKRKPGRLQGMDASDEGFVGGRRMKQRQTKTRKSSGDTGRKKRGTKAKKPDAEDSETRQNRLMKAVLLGGELTEEDLEIALDRLLEGHQKQLDESVYKTPADANAEDDIARRIELDRPRNLVKNNPTTSEVLSRVPDDELINSDEDDDEVDNIRLGEEERLQKEQIWIALNHDFLIEQEKKRLKMEADELTGNTSGQAKKRRKNKERKETVFNDSAVVNAIHLLGEGGKMLTPAESTKQMLQKKPFSKKINYDSIGELFTE